MSDGDVLVELRAWRDEFAKSHGYDLQAMTASLREMDRKIVEKLIRGEPRRPIVAKAASQSPLPTGPAIAASCEIFQTPSPARAWERTDPT